MKSPVSKNVSKIFWHSRRGQKCQKNVWKWLSPRKNISETFRKMPSKFKIQIDDVFRFLKFRVFPSFFDSQSSWKFLTFFIIFKQKKSDIFPVTLTRSRILGHTVCQDSTDGQQCHTSMSNRSVRGSLICINELYL